MLRIDDNIKEETLYPSSMPIAQNIDNHFEEYQCVEISPNQERP